MAKYSQEVIDRAKQMFDDGHTLTDIADLLGISRTTVSGWKTKYSWGDGGLNVQLTEQQEDFCIYYAKYLNPYKAYKKAYGCTEFQARKKANELIQKPYIKKRIDEIIYDNTNDKKSIQKSVLQKLLDIAFADINDFLVIETKEEEDENGNLIKKTYTHLKDDFDGTLVSNVITAKGEVKIQLADKLKAIEMLLKTTNLLDDETVRKLKIEETMAKIEETKARTKSITGDVEEYADDGFVEALEGKVDEIWQEEN